MRSLDEQRLAYRLHCENLRSEASSETCVAADKAALSPSLRGGPPIAPAVRRATVGQYLPLATESPRPLRRALPKMPVHKQLGRALTTRRNPLTGGLTGRHCQRGRNDAHPSPWPPQASRSRWARRTLTDDEKT
jgi:hypothetical protein